MTKLLLFLTAGWLFFAIGSAAQSVSLSRLLHRYHQLEALETTREAAEDFALEVRAAEADPALALEYDYWKLRGDAEMLAARRAERIEEQMDAWPFLEGAARAYLNAWRLAVVPAERKEVLRAIGPLAELLRREAGLLLNYDRPEAAYALARQFDRIDSLWRRRTGRPLLDTVDEQDHRYVRAMAAYLSGRTTEAIPVLEELAAVDYPAPWVYMALATAYRPSDDVLQGQILAKGRRLFPYHPELLNAFVQYHLEHRRYGTAREALAAALDQAPDPLEVHQALGDLYRRWYADRRLEWLYDSARFHYEAVLERSPTHYEASLGLARVAYMRAGDLRAQGIPQWRSVAEEALRRCRWIEHHNPNERAVIEALVEIYQWRGEERLAKAFEERLRVLQQGGVLNEPFFSEK